MTKKKKSVSEKQAFPDPFQMITDDDIDAIMQSTPKLEEQIKALKKKVRALGKENALLKMSTIKSIITREMRNKRAWSVLFADIDSSAQQLQTDEMLMNNVTQTLQMVSREGDLVMRYYEKICIFVWDIIAKEDVEKFAKRYYSASLATATTVEEDSIFVSVNIGACFVPSDSSMELEHVVAYAIKALYEAKDQSCDCVVFSDRRKIARD